MTQIIAPEILRKRVSELPAMPRAVQDVLAALRKDDATADECADRIARDLALTAQTLRLANSAFYGVAGRVASVRNAVRVLGLRTLETLLEAAALVNRFPNHASTPLHGATFWRNSIGTAIAARTMAAELRLDANVAFTAGMLHDIGLLALATHFPDQFAQAQALQQAEKLPPLQAERLSLGTDHAEVGALVARHWHYPPAIVDAIAQHHQHHQYQQPVRIPTITQIVQVANHIAPLADQPAGERNQPLPQPIDAAWTALGLNATQFQHVSKQTALGVESLCQALGV
jgi:putative nucleotidyltransferase with HDIG domain